VAAAALALSAAVGVLPAPAAEPPAVRLAVVDLATIRRESTAAKSIAQQLEVYLADYQNDIEKEEGALRQAQEELDRKKVLLSAEAYAEERRLWETAVAEAQRRFLRRRQAMDQARAEAWARLSEAVDRVLRDLASERGLSVVLRRDHAMFVAPAVEMTAEVLRRIDLAVPTIPVAVADS
jgi:outer membrane protein